MIIDKEFLRVAQKSFSPYCPYSGTENVALLLYSMVRISRPRVVVEYGSGYTTLFILAALAENTADSKVESALLKEKTELLGGLNTLNLGSENPAFTAWLEKPDKSCCVDPGYYLDLKPSHLYSFEEKGEDDEYSRRMRSAVETLDLSQWFSHVHASGFSIDSLPPDARPVDLAWNDALHYKEFFEAFWPTLNPKGGLMIFHNTVARKYSWDAIQWMSAKRSLAKDMEVVTLPEIHKLNQNSCTILRRITAYQPPCLTRHPEEILRNTVRFMQNQE